MRELSLFSGAGGGLLGTKLLGWRTVGYVEWNEYCKRVIAARIADGYLDRAPIFGDVRQFVESGAAREYRGFADVVTGGFPCQPFSVAGKQQAADDSRNMWPATRDCIRDVQPRSVLLENVPGLISCGYLGTVITDLAALGYVGRWGVIGAADCGAPHERDRLWVVAHSSRQQRNGGSNHAGKFLGRRAVSEFGNGGRAQDISDADRSQREGRRASVGVQPEYADAGCRRGWWSTDPADDPKSRLGRMAPRLANGVDRLKAIGNGQVPAVVARAWRELA